MNQQEYNQELFRFNAFIEQTKDEPLLESRHKGYMAQLKELEERFGGTFPPPPPPPPPPITPPPTPSLGFFKNFKQEILAMLVTLPAGWFFLLIIIAVIALVSFPLYMVLLLG